MKTAATRLLCVSKMTSSSAALYDAAALIGQPTSIHSTTHHQLYLSFFFFPIYQKDPVFMESKIERVFR
jgi:hypothetical protein